MTITIPSIIVVLAFPALIALAVAGVLAAIDRVTPASQSPAERLLTALPTTPARRSRSAARRRGDGAAIVGNGRRRPRARP
jgi:hypothetical protein